MTFLRRHGKWLALALLGAALLAGWATHRLNNHLAEIFGALFGIASTILMIEAHIANFPTGILYSIGYIILFYEFHLYGNMGLQFYYIVFQLVGWIHWARQRKDAPLRVRRASPQELILLSLCCIPATWWLVLFLQRMGGSTPYFDAISTVLALAAQYLLNGKRVENWVLGIVISITVCVMSVLNSLWLTAGLYGLFFVMSIFGLRAWLRVLRAQEDGVVVR